MKKLLCKATMHIFRRKLLPSHVVTIEDGMRKTWVVTTCPTCKVLMKIGLAHETEATKENKASKLPDGWKFI